MLRDKALLAGAGSSLNQEQLEERRERGRDRGLHQGRPVTGFLSQSSQQQGPFMECAAAQSLIPRRMKRGLEGSEEGNTHPIGLWLCTNKVLSLKQGAVFEVGRVGFQTGMLFPVRDEGSRGWGLLVKEKPPLSGFLPTEFSLQLAVWCLVKDELELMSPRVSYP